MRYLLLSAALVGCTQLASGIDEGLGLVVVGDAGSDAGQDGGEQDAGDGGRDAGDCLWKFQLLSGLPVSMNVHGEMALALSAGTETVTGRWSRDGGISILGVLPDGGVRRTDPQQILDDGCILANSLLFLEASVGTSDGVLWCPDGGLRRFERPDAGEFTSPKLLFGSNGLFVGQVNFRPYYWANDSSGFLPVTDARQLGSANGVSHDGLIVGETLNDAGIVVAAAWRVDGGVTKIAEVQGQSQWYAVGSGGEILGACGVTDCIWAGPSSRAAAVSRSPGFSSARARRFSESLIFGSQMGARALPIATIWMDGGLASPTLLPSWGVGDRELQLIEVKGMTPDGKMISGNGYDTTQFNYFGFLLRRDHCEN